MARQLAKIGLMRPKKLGIIGFTLDKQREREREKVGHRGFALFPQISDPESPAELSSTLIPFRGSYGFVWMTSLEPPHPAFPQLWAH